MAYKKKIVKKTTAAPANPLLGGLVGQFLSGYGTNLMGAAGQGSGTVRKVIKYKK